MTKPFQPGIGAEVRHNGHDAVVVAQYYQTVMCCLRWVEDGVIYYAHGIEVVDET